MQEKRILLRLLPLLSVVTVLSFFSARWYFFFSFFLSSFFANGRYFFLKFCAKKPPGLTTEKPRQETEKRSGERDLKMFDLSLLKRTDSLFYFALWWRASLVVLSLNFFVALFLTFARLLSNERTNEWMISKRLSDLRLLWSDVCSSKTPLSFLTYETTTRMKFFRSLSVSLSLSRALKKSS